MARLLCKGTATAVLLAVLCMVLVGSAVVRAEEGVADLTDKPKVNPSITNTDKGTDSGTVEREKESMSSLSFQRQIREDAQKFEFQAEVGRLMDIIVHSLYSNKDIFLRELISNASDALDKIRFLSLTNPSVLGDTTNLEIKIWADKEAKALYIRDTGIGMTHKDLVDNLGTIARSGTSAFLEQMQKSGDMNLIGQFGVGFYSVYLVSDYVEVVTKHNDDKQYIWASGAQGSFSISEDTEGEQLGRGTLLRIHLKDEAAEYLQDDKLKSLVERYSEFINFPIYLQVEKEVEIPVEEEETKDEKVEDAKEEETKDDESEESEDDEDVVDEEDEAESKDEEKKEKKTRKEKRKEFDLLNDVKAIWLRNPSEVTDEEYQKFYKAISKDYSDALGWLSFRAEGDVEFKSLLYIPKTAPFDFYEKYYEKKGGSLKLYVRRVFISDEVAELLPRYLAFVKGLVDSDTLPLNVSREMLQAHSSLKTIRKKLVRKVLDYIKKWADDDKKCRSSKEGDEGRPGEEECGKYKSFWEQFGRAIKLGIMEDQNNKSRLAKLLRVVTSSSPETPISLDEYVARMKEGQKNIYFIAGANKDEVSKSPFAERLVKKGYEVVYFTDTLDEYLMQHLPSYDDHTFTNIAKEDLQLAKEDEEAEKEALKTLKESFKGLTKWWKGQLGDKVSAVKVSNRLSTTPCVIVSSKYGHSANMERIMKAQAFSNPGMAAMMRGQRSLEINPRHPLVVALKNKVEASEEDATAKTSAALLYETALLESGFSPDDVKAFSQKMYELMGSQLGVEGDLHPSEEEPVVAAPSTSDSSSKAAKDDDDDDEDVKEEL